MSERIVGAIKWYDSVKRYGFISRPGEKDLFVHRSKLLSDESLYVEGAKVEFEIVETPKGLSAVDVEFIN